MIPILPGSHAGKDSSNQKKKGPARYVASARVHNRKQLGGSCTKSRPLTAHPTRKTDGDASKGRDTPRRPQSARVEGCTKNSFRPKLTVSPTWQGVEREELSEKEAFESWVKGFEEESLTFRSQSLLCKIKLEQALSLCKKDASVPSRIRTVAAFICLEQLGKSLHGEQQQVLFTALSEFHKSIFAFSGPETAMNSNSSTYFERCTQLEAANRHLQEQLEYLEQSQRKLTEYLEKAKDVHALNLFQGAVQSGTVPQARKGSLSEVTPTPVDQVKFEDTIVSAFAQLAPKKQHNLLEKLSFRCQDLPKPDLAVCIFNQMKEEDRTKFLCLIKANSTFQN